MPYKIVFIDWKSSDGTREAVKELAEKSGHIFHADDSDLGYADCNTFWMKQHPEFDYIFLLNNDCEVFPGWLEYAITAALNDPTIGHVAPWISRGDWFTTMSHGANLDFHCNTVVPFMNFNRAHPKMKAALDTEGLYFAYAGFGLYRMDLCKALGYLECAPNARIYWDDTDYGMKVNSAGFKVQYIPQSRVGHIMHIDDNRSHHNQQNSLEYGRVWFKGRWGDFVSRNGGYDPMVIKNLPYRTDLQENGSVWSYYSSPAVRALPAFEWVEKRVSQQTKG